MFRYIKLSVALALCVIVLFCFTVSSNAQVNVEASIEGFINGLDDQTIYLRRNSDNNGMPDTVAITVSKNGKFSINNIAVNGAEFFFLTLGNSGSYKTLFLEASKTMVIKGSISEWPAQIMVSGSQAHEDYANFRKVDTTFAKDETGTEKRYGFWRDFITSNPQSFYTPLLIVRFQSQLDIEGLKKEYDKLTPENKASYWGSQLKKEIGYNIQRAQLKIGGTVQDFTSTMPNGQKLSLYEVVKKGKYTLIDFWASWCQPCISEFPNVKKVFEKYHPLGFNIIGVSIDDREKPWKNAIGVQGLQWYNVSDLDGAKGVLAKSFGINYVPNNFLVDSKGKIVAKGLIESKLVKKMEELLGTNKQ